jgi:NitT/TauT family transport system substrate-binding protein
MTLLMVAKDEHFFEKRGLDVDLKQFTAGKFALQAFLGGSIDFAVAGDVPVCLATLQGNRMKVIAQVVERTTNEVRVVALKDPGIGYTLDAHAYFVAHNRKLATSLGGGPEFFTYKFLKNNRVSSSDVHIVSQRPEDMPAALAAHSVDAISIFDPFAFIAEQLLRDNVITFRDPNIYSELYVLTATDRETETQGETIVSVLKALADAQNFVGSNPDAAKQMMQRYTKLDSTFTDGIWNNFVFRIAITDRLLDYWKEESDWAKVTRKIPANAPPPDFGAIIERRFLKQATAGSQRN